MIKDRNSQCLYIHNINFILMSQNCIRSGKHFQVKILVIVTQSTTNVPQMNNTSTSGMNEE